jgi:hypothetical protein
MVMAARAINAVVSAHNGLISLSFQDGIAVPFLYIMSCIYLVVNRRSVSSFYVIMSAFTVASMFFEELVINQLFIFSVTLTICAAWVHYVRRTMRKMVTQKLTGRSIALGRRP